MGQSNQQVTRSELARAASIRELSCNAQQVARYATPKPTLPLNLCSVEAVQASVHLMQWGKDQVLHDATERRVRVAAW